MSSAVIFLFLAVGLSVVGWLVLRMVSLRRHRVPDLPVVTRETPQVQRNPPSGVRVIGVDDERGPSAAP